MQVVRNVVFDPRMLPGGGATELAIAQAISKSVNDVEGEDHIRSDHLCHLRQDGLTSSFH